MSSGSSLGMTNALTTNGSGMGTGIDVTAMVNEQMTVLRQPETLLKQQSATLSSQSSELSQLNTELTTLQTSFQGLTDFDGEFNYKLATSSDTSQLNAAADPTALAGTHTIVVTNIATTSSYSATGSNGKALATGDTAFGQGSFSIQVGSNQAVTINVGSTNDTLNTLAAYINKQNIGVTASVITDSTGARLSLLSQSTGSAGNITIDNNTDSTTDSNANTTGLSFAAGTTGKDAVLSVDGVNIDSSSNTISTVIPGVTINLTGANPDSPVSLTVGPDTTTAGSAVVSFVNAYNTLIQDINSQFNYNPSTGGTAPPLNGDSTLQILQEQLFSNISSSMTNNGNINSLADLGITMNNDGTLSINSATLSSVLTGQYNSVENFFQNTGSFGQNFITSLNSLTSPVSGALNVEMNGISQMQNDITSQINDMEASLTVQQQQLTSEYSTIETELQELPLTLSQINAELGDQKG
jgi:flagellar hook-associated protein 2